MVLLFSPANVITMINIYKQLSICLKKDYVWALYLLNMIEGSLVCQSTLISCSSVRSVMNILRRWTHSFMYSNVNNLKNLHVANLPNYGNNYYQNVKMLAKRKSNKKVERPKTPCLGKIPTQATPMLMTQVKYLTLPSTPKGATIYEYPSHHESYAVASHRPRSFIQTLYGEGTTVSHSQWKMFLHPEFWSDVLI